MTGLVMMRNRWFQPTTGMFITPDPVGYVDSSNPYSFAAGDPVNRHDPTGLALYAFDGTDNNRAKMKNDTNVAKLYDAYRDGVGRYREGVGSTLLTLPAGGFSGWGGQERLRTMKGTLDDIYNAGDHNIDIIGFSRGAALAVAFSNVIFREGIYDTRLRARIIPEIRFLGIFDMVGSFGLPGNSINIGYELSVPSNVRRARHATAQDEKRTLFPLTRLWDPRCGRRDRIVEVGFPGSHSDVGGGYQDNDYLSRIPLKWMWLEMLRAGIKMDAIDSSVGDIPVLARADAHKSHRSWKHLVDWQRIEEMEFLGWDPQRTEYYPPCAW